MHLLELNAASDRAGWETAAREQGLRLTSLPGQKVMNARGRLELLDQIRAAMAEDRTVLLFADHGMQDGLEPFLEALPETLTVIPVGSDAMLLSRGSCSGESRASVNTYLTYGGSRNIRSMLGYLRYAVFADPEAPAPEPPEILPFDGIYGADPERVYDDPEEFISAEQENYPVYVGMLSHRSAWISRSLHTEQALIRALHRENIGVIPVFSAGEKSEKIRSLSFQEIADRYFSRQGRLRIQGLVNFQLHLIKGEQGKSIGETSADYFERLGVPVFHPISSYFVTDVQWARQENPLARELQTDYLNPEMAGMVEPILASLRSEDGKTYVPREENLALLARRIRRWIGLRTKPNGEKKIALMLHNAVCAGVEATLGKAFGLDAFESTVRLMKRLQREGYHIRDIPETGEDLRQLLLEKKAFSDFRWTSVEDIAACGGCLYRMNTDLEYMTYFRELPEPMQKRMTESWGPAPGEGMVLGRDLIITGLDFGNFRVLVQPKRGCYGPKCTGEVCRILHDPVCPPTHQYLATYRYLERDWQADAVIHMGSDGSLEYLPGKASGLGTESWSYQVLGALPNFYPYHLGVTAEGTIARRRGNASLVGHYPASARGLDPEDLELLDALNAFEEAIRLDNGQAEALQKKVEALTEGKPGLRRLLQSGADFPEGAAMVRSSLLRCAEGRKVSDLHVFGENPSDREARSYVCEVLRGRELVRRQPGEDEIGYSRRLEALVEEALAGKADPLSLWIRDLQEKLDQTFREQDCLLELLCGRYQRPGEGGMPDENGDRILPAGRNFYLMNGEKIPTPTAFQRGKLLADQLLEAYQQDEGRYPKKIAMNMISLDIGRTHGEQLSQFLWLLGVEPIWDRAGRVRSLEPVPIGQLGRPRIDITLRISGVMRDTWPMAVELMDQAVMLVSQLPEDPEDNYVLANIRQMEAECGRMDERSRTIRIFGDPPGAFGAGIDLALKASAWESDRDLARYFIQSSAYAYGQDLEGRKSVREFVHNAKNVDLSCDVTASRRMDTLSCGFGVQVQGGFRLLAKALGNREIRQYQATAEPGETVKTRSLSGQIQEDTRQTLLNETWKSHAQARGYQGAAEIMARIQTAFDAQCTSEVFPDRMLEELTEAYLGDPRMRDWLLQVNPYAAEEIGRRLLELESRGRWKPSPETLDALRETYLSFEGRLEDGVSGRGEIQGSAVEIVRDDQVEIWKDQLRDIDNYLQTLEQKK